MPLVAGTRLGPYEILALIGRGGMGEVYRAHDPRLNRVVAIKTVRSDVAGDPERLQRFEHEARAASALNHPNILTIYDIGHEGETAYIAMEWVDGTTLHAVIAAGRLATRRLVEIAQQIAAGLAKAHAAGIIHRDLKPENVMIADEGLAKIVDFGLAKLVTAPDESESVTHGPSTLPGMVMGTVGYMSPEQASGRPADQRSDQFAFGVILYEMATGKRPFQRETSAQTLAAIIDAHPAPIRDLNPNVPEHLALVIDRCLTKDPRGRYDSTRDLVRDLAHIAETTADRARTDLARSMRNRVRWIAAVAAVAVFTLLIWVWRNQRDILGAVGSRSATAVRQAPEHGLAILPFENIGGVADSYFASGITEEVAAQLSKIKTLRVLSRAAVSPFRGGVNDLSEMTRQLRISAVVIGSVRHAGANVRVGVQLVGAPDGETLWSEQYDRELKDIFTVQSDIALRVTRALRSELAPAERERIERRPTDNAAAYDLYLRQTELRFAEAIPVLQQAIALDPRFALAYASLARRYYSSGVFSGRADLERGVAAARTALTIDPQLARAHHVLAINLMQLGKIDDARIAFLRAIELDPSFQAAMNDLSVAEANFHRFDQSLYWARRAFPLAPNLAVSYYHLGVGLVWLDDDPVAERWLLNAAARFPTNGRVQILLAILDFRRGRNAEAIIRMRKAVAADPEDSEAEFMLAELATLTTAPDAAVIVDRLLKQSRDYRGWLSPHTVRTWRAHLWMKVGQPSRARPLVDEALEANLKSMAAGDRTPALPLENVALYLMKGDRATALQWLDRADQAGWNDAREATRDPLLVELRDDPRFTAFLARIERDVGAMRQRSDFSGLDALPAR